MYDVEELTGRMKPEWYLSRWPEDEDLVFVGSHSGDYAALALTFGPVDPSAAASLSIGKPGSVPSMSPRSSSNFWGCGLVGVLSYDDYFRGKQSTSRFYQIRECVLFDLKSAKTFHVKSALTPLKFETKMSLERLCGLDPQQDDPTSGQGLKLVPLSSDHAYLSLANKALEDIKKGRYYQINLLRYFELAQPVLRSHLLRRFFQLAGPFGAWIREGAFELVSFSPERFVRVQSKGGKTKLIAEPIKGTIASSADPEERAILGLQLLESRKDNAELHMIVDLLRNDIFNVSKPGTICVESPGRLLTFPTIQHLMATVASELREGMNLEEFFCHLLPGGSITGVPKKEVMNAIFEYEQRSRGYFMGNIFYLSANNDYLDSNILIRTLVRAGPKWSYAAGSGIVIKSDPVSELQEISYKCSVLTQSLHKAPSP